VIPGRTADERRFSAPHPFVALSKCRKVDGRDTTVVTYIRWAWRCLGVARIACAGLSALGLRFDALDVAGTVGRLRDRYPKERWRNDL